MRLSKPFNNAVEVKNTNKKGEAIFAVRDIKTGEKFGYFEGKETSENHMHTIHLDGKVIDGSGETLSFLAHSCGANAYFKDKKRWLYARTDISSGEEVTIDYLETEPKITEPFECKCGASNCRGHIGPPQP